MNMRPQNNAFIADILIVDDKLENIRFLSDFLSKENYQIRKAINGQAALMAVNSLLPDLILLDINMPGIGGYEVCKYLKNDPKTSSTPVIFLSAGNEVDDKVRAFEVGGIDYITKPFHLEEVLARVRTQLKIQNLQKDLISSNEKLQTMFLSLQNAQSELIQKENLINASRIAAGISHEINNPLSFILCNINPASEYSEQLINLIRLYQKSFPDATPQIKNFMAEIELDFLLPDFTRILHSIRTGAERIRSVIQALHIFYRLDKSGIKIFDIHENIDSTIVTLGYQFKIKDDLPNISIIKDYVDIPEFTGYVNLFNQAIINLLQNSIDALEAKINLNLDNSFQPTIWIHTHTTDNKIIISIKDNGIGVAAENRSSLFQPFFTTKLVGKKYGLGLFTTYQIINDLHQGNLIYHNCPEGGSEFVIELPISKL
ncbi:hybrid sensor histidine kinase/response regulator [Anabaena cylindrica FACHB-243]|nr:MULTISPECIES: response regulator [Anabaena]MBD2418011.1 hybrid sensor histidine kinase/response regulator [Anabaena cylindrica FACHB-243]MBY5285448.1 hybrid sensor histidine kinase/response regulator [Anabaena sp. CCAP 1446/1C]MBY5309696.1 hybrid sensor histidine kinase/response regulator [Anabaena sp. CCAP 1446/1C]MCM2408783.1 hybrid sensor histidine kinase/response regulator [Anabaena sp. CCAP 1446/1C]